MESGDNQGGRGYKRVNYDEPLWDREMDSLFDKEEIVVIDNGSETIKVGFAGEDTPRVRLTINIRRNGSHLTLLL